MFECFMNSNVRNKVYIIIILYQILLITWSIKDYLTYATDIDNISHEQAQ